MVKYFGQIGCSKFLTNNDVKQTQQAICLFLKTEQTRTHGIQISRLSLQVHVLFSRLTVYFSLTKKIDWEDSKFENMRPFNKIFCKIPVYLSTKGP